MVDATFYNTKRLSIEHIQTLLKQVLELTSYSNVDVLTYLDKTYLSDKKSFVFFRINTLSQDNDIKQDKDVYKTFNLVYNITVNTVGQDAIGIALLLCNALKEVKPTDDDVNFKITKDITYDNNSEYRDDSYTPIYTFEFDIECKYDFNKKDFKDNTILHVDIKLNSNDTDNNPIHEVSIDG